MPNYCLIVEPSPLVARDLALTAEEYGLTAIIVANDEAALNWLAQAEKPRLSVAFIHQGAEVFENSPLHRQLAGVRVRIVLMGGDVAQLRGAGHWWSLEWPFTTGHVSALLDRLGLRRPGECEP